MANTQAVPSQYSSPEVESEVLGPLEVLGFEILAISPEKVSGRLRVTRKCIQPFKVLHGGVSAMIAEGLASMGGHLASGLKRVAGIHLSIDHLKPAFLGDLIFAEGTPITLGKTIQVWEVRLYKLDPVDEEKRSMISTSRVTLLASMPASKHTETAAEELRKLAAKL